MHAILPSNLPTALLTSIEIDSFHKHGHRMWSHTLDPANMDTSIRSTIYDLTPDVSNPNSYLEVVPLRSQAGVHPEQPGCTLSREAFDAVWEHSVLLMQRGFKTGSILTVDPEEALVLGEPWTRRCASCQLSQGLGGNNSGCVVIEYSASIQQISSPTLHVTFKCELGNTPT